MIFVSAFLALVAIAAPAQEAAPNKTRVEELVRRMGAERAEEREKAFEELKSLGKPVVPELKATLASVKDPEVRGRIARLLAMQEPAIFRTLESYLDKAGVDVIAIDLLRDDAVAKALPEATFIQLWQRGQGAAWKVLGFDAARNELFDAAEPKAWPHTLAPSWYINVLLSPTELRHLSSTLPPQTVQI